MSADQNYKRKKKDDMEDVVIVGENYAKPTSQKLPERQMPEMSFDAWWMRIQKKHSFTSEMKEIVFKHFKARGFIASNKFDDGLKDFGIKS